ncbi:hypothetical protein LIA77_05248 [Sarocladium implicatum]|nr:hypothetical protein LIA77_05248 [Sarocladium implicatum]
MKRAANQQLGEPRAAEWLHPYVLTVDTPWPTEITPGEMIPIECNFGVPFGRGYNPRKSKMEVFISHEDGEQLGPKKPLATHRFLLSAPTRVGDITSHFSTPGFAFPSAFRGRTFRLKVVVHAVFEWLENRYESRREEKDAIIYSPEIKVSARQAQKDCERCKEEKAQLIMQMQAIDKKNKELQDELKLARKSEESRFSAQRLTAYPSPEP